MMRRDKRFGLFLLVIELVPFLPILLSEYPVSISQKYRKPQMQNPNKSSAPTLSETHTLLSIFHSLFFLSFCSADGAQVNSIFLKIEP